MGLTGFNRQRRAALAEEVGQQLANELIALGINDVKSLDRLDEVTAVLGMSDNRAKKLKARVSKARGTQKAEEALEPEEPTETTEYPKPTGGGWYELSSGKKVQGAEKAQKAEEALS